MKLSKYAKKIGISYQTAWRWWRDGLIQGYQSETGTIIITEVETNVESSSQKKTVLYARVSSNDQRADLEKQVARLRDFAAAQGYLISMEVTEIASGLNDTRPKLTRLLVDSEVNIIIIEHKDRLTRFGFNYIKTLLEAQNRQLVVINNSDTKDELIDDFVSVITSMCARIYGRRNARQRAQRVRECLEDVE